MKFKSFEAQIIEESNMIKELEYIQNRAQGIAKYSNKLRESIKEIEAILSPEFEKAGIEYIYPELVISRFNEYHGNVDYRVKITKKGSEWGLFLDSIKYDTEYVPLIWVPEARRGELKQIAVHLIRILSGYSKRLEQNLIEIHDISEKTEKMAKAISS